MFPANPGALEKQIAASSFNSEDRAPAKWSFSGLYWSSGKRHRRALEKQIRVFLTNAGVLEKQIGTFPVNSVALKKQSGAFPVYSGALEKQTGVLATNSGALEKQMGVFPAKYGALEKQSARGMTF